MIELERASLGNLVELDRGSQAVVFRAGEVTVPGVTGPFVYKEYLPKVRAGRHGIRNSLSGLIRIHQEQADKHRAMLDMRSAWPLAVVLQDGVALGLIMRELPQKYFTEIRFSTGRVKTVTCDSALYLQDDDELAARNLTLLTETGRMWLMARTLSFMNLVHEIGLIVGDFSPNNVVFHINAVDQTKNEPIFVDVDSFRLATGVPALAQAHTPDWETPESVRNASRYRALVRSNAGANDLARAGAAMRVQDRASDVYKVALFVMRNFHTGENAHSVMTSPGAFDRLAKIQPSFVPALKRALSEDPKARPTMNELTRAFVGNLAARKP